jgi:hypothetical protein
MNIIINKTSLKINNEKAKKIRTQLLLFVDKEIKKKSKKNSNERYIKPYDSKNEDYLKITFQENFNNSMGKCIQFFSSDNKEIVQNISFFQSKSKTLRTFSDCPSSSLSTQENSIKKNMPISKLIRHQKVIPENLIGLLEVVKRKKSIFICLSNTPSSASSYDSNITNTLNNYEEEEDFIKYQNYLNKLCGNFKINLIKE